MPNSNTVEPDESRAVLIARVKTGYFELRGVSSGVRLYWVIDADEDVVGNDWALLMSTMRSLHSVVANEPVDRAPFGYQLRPTSTYVRHVCTLVHGDYGLGAQDRALYWLDPANDQRERGNRRLPDYERDRDGRIWFTANPSAPIALPLPFEPETVAAIRRHADLRAAMLAAKAAAEAEADARAKEKAAKEAEAAVYPAAKAQCAAEAAAFVAADYSLGGARAEVYAATKAKEAADARAKAAAKAKAAADARAKAAAEAKAAADVWEKGKAAALQAKWEARGTRLWRATAKAGLQAAPAAEPQAAPAAATPRKRRPLIRRTRPAT